MGRTSFYGMSKVFKNTLIRVVGLNRYEEPIGGNNTTLFFRGGYMCSIDCIADVKKKTIQISNRTYSKTELTRMKKSELIDVILNIQNIE